MKKDKISYLAVDHKSAINDDGETFYVDDTAYFVTFEKRTFFKIKRFVLRNNEILAHLHEDVDNKINYNFYININKIFKYINGAEI